MAGALDVACVPLVGVCFPYGDGYLLIAGDGGVFNFSDRRFAGSGAGVLDDPVVDIAATRPAASG